VREREGGGFYHLVQLQHNDGVELGKLAQSQMVATNHPNDRALMPRAITSGSQPCR
jgi:hypothetical protein